MLDANPIVKIDQCHIDLIYGLLVSHKPGKALEIGMGSGVITDVIVKAFEFNDIPLKLTCVDNWLDWKFSKPDGISKYEDMGVLVISSAERDFVLSCREKYDFIISDADHYHSHEWFDRTLSLLRPEGVMICHDVTNSGFSNLRIIYRAAKWGGLPHLLFNSSSRKDERCDRGLLVVREGGNRIRLLAVFFLFRMWEGIRGLRLACFERLRSIKRKGQHIFRDRQAR